MPSLDELAPGAAPSGRGTRRPARPDTGPAVPPEQPVAGPPPGPPVLRVVPSADVEAEPAPVDEPQAAPARRAAGQRDWADVLMGGGRAPSTAEPRQDQ